MPSEPEEDTRPVVMLTYKEALDLGIVVCQCGHPKADHYRPINFEYCMHCTCEGYHGSGFKVGRPVKHDLRHKKH